MKLGAFFAKVGRGFHDVEESGKDFVAGVMRDDAMNSKDRRVDEFKIAAGLSAFIAGMIELGPFAFFTTAPAAIVPTIEGVKDIAEHGHDLREKVEANKNQLKLAL